MSAVYYEQLALDWKPESRGNTQYNIIALVVVLLMSLLGFVVSSISVPEDTRAVRNAVPERIAKFITEKKSRSLN